MSLEFNASFILLMGVAWGAYFLRPKLFEGRLYVILLAVSFAISSIAMHTLNKVCVSLTHAASTVTVIQMGIAIGIVMGGCAAEVRRADQAQLRRWCVVPIFYAAMLNTSLLGYQYLTLSLITVFRNLAPLVTLAVERLVMPPEFQPSMSAQVVLSLLLMLSGAVVYGANALEFNWTGVGLLCLNSLIAIADRLIQRRLLVSECRDLPLSACMAVNNSLGMIPSLALVFISGEVSGYAENAVQWSDPATLVLVLLSGLMGLGICYFGLACQKQMSATSFQVLQNLSKVAVVACGVVIFGDHIDSQLRILGMGMSLLGSFCYGYARVLEDEKKSRGEAAPLFPKQSSMVAKSSQV